MKTTMRVASLLILIAGMCLTGRAIYLHAKAQVAGMLIRRAWEQSIQSGQTRRPWPWADTHPVARIEIPRLGYDEIVLEGATPRTLAFGPARLVNGAGLGEPGNLVLAGHRTSWFLPLENIAAGDTIQIEWFDAQRHELRRRSYTVNTIRVVDPRNTTFLAPTSEDALTLVTCYPFGSGPSSPQRYMVRASPVGPSQHPGKAALKPAAGPQIADRRNDLRVPLETIW
jgi:sortase A